MDDIRPPKRPAIPPVAPPDPLPQADIVTEHIEVVKQGTIMPDAVDGRINGKKPRRNIWLVLTSTLVIGIVAIFGLFFAWYQLQLQPVSRDEGAARVRVTIESGTTPDQIATLLVDQQLVRSVLAFRVYTKLSSTENILQAGTYSLSPAETTPEIVAHLTSGKTDEFEMTFLPGATLQQNRAALIKSGYSEVEVDKALAKSYNHPLFKTKPASADLEGYIYGETYRFASSASVEDILVRTFDEFYKVITDNNLEAGFKKQGLSLFEGITLASIIQREAGGGDERQIAQVFLLRLEKGIPLGSDVTYQYIADKLGIPRSTTLDNPYNTRVYPGLPPGPISTPGVVALEAVASPSPGDYLYFLSGDDDVTYYGRTEAEHQANIRNHCQKKCQII